MYVSDIIDTLEVDEQLNLTTNHVKSLRYFARNKHPCNVKETAKALEKPNTATYRLLRELAEMRFLAYKKKESNCRGYRKIKHYYLNEPFLEKLVNH